MNPEGLPDVLDPEQEEGYSPCYHWCSPLIDLPHCIMIVSVWPDQVAHPIQHMQTGALSVQNTNYCLFPKLEDSKSESKATAAIAATSGHHG